MIEEKENGVRQRGEFVKRKRRIGLEEKKGRVRGRGEMGYRKRTVGL